MQTETVFAENIVGAGGSYRFSAPAATLATMAQQAIFGPFFATIALDASHVAAAWVFAGFRALHSAVHCTFNLVLLRFYLYLFASLALWYMAARAALVYFGAAWCV